MSCFIAPIRGLAPGLSRWLASENTQLSEAQKGLRHADSNEIDRGANVVQRPADEASQTPSEQQTLGVFIGDRPRDCLLRTAVVGRSQAHVQTTRELSLDAGTTRER